MKLFLLPALIVLSSCASMSNQMKTISLVAGSAIVAGTIDASLRPGSRSFDSQSVAVGATTGAVTGIAALLFFNDEGKKIEAERKLKIAQEELNSIHGESANALDRESNSALERDLPKEYRGLVKPGRWSIYKTDVWVSQGENTLIHQDKMIQIENPQFQPKTKKENEE